VVEIRRGLTQLKRDLREAAKEGTKGGSREGSREGTRDANEGRDRNDRDAANLAGR